MGKSSNLDYNYQMILPLLPQQQESRLYLDLSFWQVSGDKAQLWHSGIIISILFLYVNEG